MDAVMELVLGQFETNSDDPERTLTGLAFAKRQDRLSGEKPDLQSPHQALRVEHFALDSIFRIMLFYIFL